MFSNLRSDLLDVVQNFDKMSFEEHVKNTCIKKLDACINYLSIPSVERKIERELEKEKREKLNQQTNSLGSDENIEDFSCNSYKHSSSSCKKIIRKKNNILLLLL